MDTMDILMDMGMDIMVDKHNNPNAKIGLERTPESSSSNFNQKINSTRLFVQDQRMSKVHSKILQVHISSLLFFSFCKKNSLDMILVHKKHKLYNLSSK